MWDALKSPVNTAVPGLEFPSVRGAVWRKQYWEITTHWIERRLRGTLAQDAEVWHA